MAKDTRPGGNVQQPSAWPHLQNKDKVTISNVSTTPSGKVAGQSASSVKS